MRNDEDVHLIVNKILPWFLGFLTIILIVIVFLYLNEPNPPVETRTKTPSQPQTIASEETNLIPKKDSSFADWEAGKSDTIGVKLNVLVNRQNNRLLISCYSEHNPHRLKTWDDMGVNYMIGVYDGKIVSPVKLLIVDGGEYAVPTSLIKNQIDDLAYREFYKNLNFMSGHLVLAITTDDEDYGFLFPKGDFYCK